MVPLLPMPVNDEHLLSLVHGYIRLNGLEVKKLLRDSWRRIFVNQGFNYQYVKAAALFSGAMSAAEFLDRFGYGRLQKPYLTSRIYWSWITGRNFTKPVLCQMTHGGRVLVKDAMYFWFCPCCRVDDIVTTGYARWRRSHQIIGVQVCPIHGCTLLKQCAQCGYCPGDLWALESNLPDCAQCGAHYPEMPTAGFLAERRLLFARFIQAQLSGSLPEYSIELFIDRLETEAMARYGITAAGVPARIRRDVEATFSVEELRTLELIPRTGKSAGWIRWFFAKRNYTKNCWANALIGAVVFPSFDEWKRAIVEVSKTHCVERPFTFGYPIPLTPSLLKDIAWQSDLNGMEYSEIKLQWVIAHLPGLQRVRETQLIYVKKRLLSLKLEIINRVLKTRSLSPRPAQRALYEAERRTMGRHRKIVDQTVAAIAYRWRLLHGDKYPMTAQDRVWLYGEKAKEVKG